MIESKITISTLPNGVVFFKQETHDSNPTKNEKLMAGLIDLAINTAGQSLIQHYNNGEMIVAEKLEKIIGYAVKKALEMK